MPLSILYIHFSFFPTICHAKRFCLSWINKSAASRGYTRNLFSNLRESKFAGHYIPPKANTGARGTTLTLNIILLAERSEQELEWGNIITGGGRRWCLSWKYWGTSERKFLESDALSKLRVCVCQSLKIVQTRAGNPLISNGLRVFIWLLSTARWVLYYDGFYCAFA